MIIHESYQTMLIYEPSLYEDGSYSKMSKGSSMTFFIDK